MVVFIILKNAFTQLFPCKTNINLFNRYLKEITCDIQYLLKCCLTFFIDTTNVFSRVNYSALMKMVHFFQSTHKVNLDVIEN